MGFNPVDKTIPSQGQHVDAFGSAQVMLYDQFGNPLAYQNKTVPTVPISGVPMMGLDGDAILRIPRVGDFSSLRTTSEVLLWHDAFEGATINAFWTQSLTTMTLAQAVGVLTLNNSAISTVNTAAIITSQRQFPKYPRAPLYTRFRGKLSANPNGHTLVEMGYGVPVGVTPVVGNGAFFRWTAAGTLVAVTSYNGTENPSAVLIAQGVISTANYYYYDVIMDDDYARFIVSDSSNTPIVDTTLKMPLATPFSLATSHTPTFARVYVDAVGAGTVVQLSLSSHTVQILDGMMNLPWADQMALALRHGSINPTTYAQTPSPMTAAPATETPSNTVGGYNTLGGDAAVALTVANENPLSVFGYQIPTPYTYFLRSIIFSNLFVTSAIATTGVPANEWLIIANCASGNISTGGGQRVPLGIWFSWASAAQAAGSFGFSEGPWQWQPQTPIVCLPGTFLHIAYKMFGATVVTTPGVTRWSVFVDGYFM